MKVKKKFTTIKSLINFFKETKIKKFFVKNSTILKKFGLNINLDTIQNLY